MAKPQVNKITPFDANHDNEISISWSGSRAYGNRIVIYNAESNDPVFDDTVTTFLLSHRLPAYTLANGCKYFIQCQVFDAEGAASALSDKLFFLTFETPAFQFSNVPADGKINSASFEAAVSYTSADWEVISTYKFYLYDSSKKLLLESSSFYVEDSIRYVYRGLENNTAYYLRCQGATVNGMPLDTGFIPVLASYENPNTYARIYAANDPIHGCIRYGTNLIIIQYNGSESFTYENGMINLKDKTLYYDEGFLIEDDFTIIIRGINMYQTAEILRMKNENAGLTLSSRIYNQGSVRFKLEAPNGIGRYLLYSEELTFDDEDMLTICLSRKNNLYQLKIFIEFGFNATGNIWYTGILPRNAETYDAWIDSDNALEKVCQDTMRLFLEDREPDSPVPGDLWMGGAD